MSGASVIAISGSPGRPSRTRGLVEAVLARVEKRLAVSGRLIDLAEVGPTVLAAMTRTELSEAGEGLVAQIETADLLIVGSPVYRGAYTGVLKHLFDLVDYRALTGKIAILAATGGTPLHGLVTEHYLRPLLAYFGVVTAPTAIYAVEPDFAGCRLSSPAVHDRIERSVGEAARLVAAAAGATPAFAASA